MTLITKLIAMLWLICAFILLLSAARANAEMSRALKEAQEYRAETEDLLRRAEEHLERCREQEAELERERGQERGTT